MSKIVSLESLYDLVSLSEPVLIGDRIFYIEHSISREENQYYQQIFSCDLNSKEIIAWTEKFLHISNLKTGENLKYLYYLAKIAADEKSQVYRIPLTGGGSQRLTDEETGVNNYLFHNHNILYYQTYSIIESNANKDLPQEIVISDLTYKIDGEGLLPTNYEFQFVKYQLSNKQKDVLLKDNRAYKVSYISQDESYLLYSVDYNLDDEWVYGSYLYKYDLTNNTRHEIHLENPQGILHFLSMNPAEDKLLLSGNNFDFKFTSFNHLYLYDLVKEELIAISDKIDEDLGDCIVGDFQQGKIGFQVFWLDDENFMFATTYHGATKLYRGNTQGQIDCFFNQPYHITGNSINLLENHLLITYSSINIPSRLAFLNVDTGEIEDVIDPNKTQLNSYKIIDGESFWFTNSEGIEIQGWYLAPPEIKEKIPAILYIHGGPQVCYGETFFHEMQQLVGLGYGVIMLNPRGGNSYGQAFVSSILGDYGNLDYQDLMAGLDYALEIHEEIDHERLFVVGGSYGGFMTNWIIGHNHRFKAAITQRSICNWISFYGTSDIGPFFVPFQLDEDLSNVDRLWELSPLKYAENIQTPLLIIHGEEDLRCPKEQAEQLYIAMKKNRVPTKMVLFPESNHGLSRNGKPNLRIARMDSINKWLELYS